MAWAEVTAQRAVASNSSGSSTASATYPSTPTTGNLLVATVATNGTTAATATTPSGWTPLGAVGNVVAYAKVAGASEPTTVSVTLPASNDWSMGLAEFSGSPATLTVDRAATVNNIGGTPPTTVGPTAAQTQTGNLALLAANDWTTATTTATTGYTSLPAPTATSGSNLLMAWRVVATTAAESAVVSVGAAGTAFTCAVLVTITPAAAAAVSPQRTLVGVGV